MTMNENQKEYLAQTYMNVWRAFRKDRLVTVTVEPNGWFKIKYHVGLDTKQIRHISRVRASRLLEGLVILTDKLANPTELSK